MNININKNAVAVILIVGLFFGLTVFGSRILVDKISNKVIEELRRDYSPGPYNPGFDPDKVDPTFFRQQPPPQYGNPQQWNNMWNSMQSPQR